MTRTEFYEKYGHIKVSFNSYYKFTFSYYAVLDDNSVLTCAFGGCSDEIYRVYVGASQSILLSELEPYSGEVSKNDEVIDSFYDY